MPDLIIPAAIEAVIQDLERAAAPFDEHGVQQVLSKARGTLQNPSESENFGAWAETLAFALVDTRMHTSPWRTYFGPMGSGTDKDGQLVYFPDIAGADAQVIAHWSARAKTVTHPILKARYADLAWDMCTVIANVRRDPEMARLAIDAYHASVPSTVRTERHDQFVAALRALDLAVMLRDAERIKRARAVLLQLHREVVAAHEAQWWFAFDRLIEEKNAGVTDTERQQLVSDLEELVLYYGDVSKPERFNPHVLEDAAKRLIRYYTRLHRATDTKRLHEAIARAFEHFAGLGNAMLASAVLQTSVNAYRDAGLPEESRRVRILMEEKIGQSRNNMASFETEIKISRDDMEAFLKAVVVDDLGATFVKLAAEFLSNRRHLEETVRKTLEQSPLLALMPQKIMADDHIAATVGSVQDDPFGRLLQQTTMGFGFEAVWLQTALHRAVETHSLMIEHFVGWANRLELFDDVTFLIEGVRAWFEGDLVKAVHVLVPQMEQGLRAIVAKLGKPVTKPHGTVPGVGVAIGMGDILYSEELTQALGPDLTLYFLALYADPRGMNLRNRVAHGLINPESINGNLVRLLIHTLLVFGVWKELAEQRR
jgi:lysyl-tRNA synthetase class 1